MAQRQIGPEMRQCQNYDNVRIGGVIHQPAVFLDSLVERLEAGGSVDASEQARVLIDLEGVRAFPENPSRRAYLTRFDYFSKLQQSEIQLPAVTQPSMDCTTLLRKLEALAAADAADRSARAALKRTDGVVVDNARDRALNQAQIDRPWEWKRFGDAARSREWNVPEPLGG